MTEPKWMRRVFTGCGPHVRALLLALQFLTVIPIGATAPVDKPTMGLSLLYYPLVGLLLGGLLAAVALAGQLLFSDLLAATLVVAAWAVLSGALHIDGLADSADAWVGGLGSRQRTLAIMKDPASGPVAVVAIVLLLLLKVAAVSELLAAGQLVWLLALPLLGRLAILLLLLTTPYVRAAGLGEIVSAHFSRVAAAWLCLIMAGVLLCLDFSVSWPLLIALLVTVVLLRHWMLARLQGCTGDTIGATVECVELVCLLTLVSVLT